MKKRLIRNGIWLMGAVDWNRRLFDSLIPLPEGTSYNSYLVEGSEKTAIIDTADPALGDVLLAQLEDVKKIDFIVSLHTEQDHSGMIPALLEKYPGARVVCSTKAKELLQDHLHIDEALIDAMDDGETLSLGDKTLKFIHTPWVHWPETMCAYMAEEKILFSCDFLGSHLATSEMYAGENPVIYEGAKRYYAESMMPFRAIVKKNLAKVEEYEIEIIAPSHGPLYDKPSFILDAYRDWTSDKVDNFVAIPYISMHGSTEIMVDHLLDALVERGVKVCKYELSVTDIGKLAIDLVDAATIVIGAPTVHYGPHP
ncbi:MAG: FprA family A-type flavoprotein, partial [Synergistaceae bacterium]|nr:FprA family A-type flavoprotein [Synergistaceae bacterium]